MAEVYITPCRNLMQQNHQKHVPFRVKSWWDAQRNVNVLDG